MSAASRHILYVITDLELGGVPLHLLRLARSMRKRGFRISVASLRDEGPVGQMLREDGIDVYACGGRSGLDFRVLSRLRRLMTVLRPDLMHTLLFHANLAGRWAAKRAGLPPNRVICEIQTVEVERRWHLLVDRWTYRGCRFTIGNSPSVIEHLATHARIPRDRLRLVKGGIDPDPIRNALPADRESLGLQPRDRMVLWVGRLDPVKGLSHLVEAFAEVIRTANARLILVGAGPLHGSLVHQIHGLGLADAVKLVGPRQDVPSLLRAADLFVFPSRTEGLPNALLEAMAAGLPIVATDVPGNRDLIRSEQNGLLVPYGRSSSLAQAMNRLLSDKELAVSLGLAAAHEASTNWHFQDMQDNYSRLYSDVLQGAS